MKTMDLVPLRTAVLCANCEQIGIREEGGGCPACGSRAVLMLCRVLGCLADPVQAPIRRVNDALLANATR